MSLAQKILLLYFIIMSVVAFVACGVDKSRAHRRGWRVSESALLVLSFLGGALGFLLGMLIFRHKTRKWRFALLVPLFLLLHIAIFVLCGVWPALRWAG